MAVESSSDSGDGFAKPLGLRYCLRLLFVVLSWSFTNFLINHYLEFNEQHRQTRNNSQYLRKVLVTQEIKSKLKELAILNNSRRSYIKEKASIINHIVLLLKHNNWIYNNNNNKLIIQNRLKAIRNHSSNYIKQKVDEWYYELFQTQIN